MFDSLWSGSQAALLLTRTTGLSATNKNYLSDTVYTDIWAASKRGSTCNWVRGCRTATFRLIRYGSLSWWCRWAGCSYVPINHASSGNYSESSSLCCDPGPLSASLGSLQLGISCRVFTSRFPIFQVSGVHRPHWRFSIVWMATRESL